MLKRNKTRTVSVSLAPEDIEILDHIAALQKRTRSQTVAWLAAEYARVNGLVEPAVPRLQPQNERAAG